MRLFICIIIICNALIGCASTTKCSNEFDEPISRCRAEQACLGSTGAKRFLSGTARFLSGFAAGMSGKKSNDAVRIQRECINDNMASQAYNAGKEVKQTKCISEVNGEQIETECTSY